MNHFEQLCIMILGIAITEKQLLFPFTVVIITLRVIGQKKVVSISKTFIC